MLHEHSDIYHSCISLGDHFKNILRAVPFPKALCFIFVLSSQSCVCAMSWGICSDCSKVSVLSAKLFILLKLYLQEKFRNFWLAKTVFFKDLHWIKTIKPFDFPEAKVGTGWKTVDWRIVCTRCQKNGKSAIDYGSSYICCLGRNFSLTFKRFLLLLFSCPCIIGQLLLFRLCWLSKLGPSSL